jgi:KDO2-lipid IV(A) lauroyltransferase
MLWLLRWLAARPLRHLHALGALLGWVTYALSPSYRRRLVDNARQAGIGDAERREAVAHAGRMVAELPRLWLRPAGQPIADPLRWEGADWLDRVIGEGRGLVLLTPHIGCFEVTAQAFAERFGERAPATVLYRPARKPWLRRIEETARARPRLATAPATLAGVRQLLRALRRGEAVGLLPDQVPPDGQGVWAPFFGRPAYTMTLAPRLVEATGAAIGLLWAERLPRGAGYVLRVGPLPEPLPERSPGDDEQAALRAGAAAINRAMESVIRACPAQYLWGYHRYKAPRQQETP